MECIGSVEFSLEHDLTSDGDETRRRGIEWMKRCVRIASELRGDLVCGVIYMARGKITGRRRTEAEWRRNVEALKKICSFAKDYGSVLGIEPVDRFETYLFEYGLQRRETGEVLMSRNEGS